MSYWDPSDVSGNLRGRPLRYLLVVILDGIGGPCSLAELQAACENREVVFSGRPSKVISDALRWEVRAGRVKRVGRGMYAVDRIPRSTRSWIGERTAQTLHWLEWAAAQRHGSSATPDLYLSGGTWVPQWPLWPQLSERSEWSERSERSQRPSPAPGPV